MSNMYADRTQLWSLLQKILDLLDKNFKFTLNTQ